MLTEIEKTFSRYSAKNRGTMGFFEAVQGGLASGKSIALDA
jgi:hypothetical protein